MRYFSMFSGIGGFELGISRAVPNAECIGYSEIDKPAIKTYEEHYEHRNFGDATTINPADLPDFDLLVGGFPCQAFSVAGKRKGFDDTRGTLFFDIARILKDKRPRHLVLENVKGLLSHDGGKTFQTILGVLSDLGYIVEWQVLNSKNHGVPQNRERIYIIGHLGGFSGRQVFPLGRKEQEDTHTRLDVSQGAQAIATRHLGRNGGLISPIASTVQSSETPHVIDVSFPSRARVYSDYTPTVRDYGSGGNKMPMVSVREATKQGYAEATIGDTINISVPTSKTRRGRVQKGLAGTLQTSESMATLLPDARIRRLTPIECERLQGFPDNWTIGSDTQRYKQCGNAVTVNVVETVMSKLYQPVEVVS